MKKVKIICAILAATALTVTTFAASTAVMKNIYVQMGGINVTYLGADLELTDATGATVEPILYNGTTYLPVRAVSEAAGLEVDWIAETSTVALNGTSVTYLDEMSCLFESSKEEGSTFNSKSNVLGFDRALYVKSLAGYDYDSMGDSEVTSLYYTLDGNYKTFATAIDSHGDNYMEGSIIRIYGDSEILYTSPSIVEESPVYEIELDVSEVTQLHIEITSVKTSKYEAYRDFYFGEARLVK